MVWRKVIPAVLLSFCLLLPMAAQANAAEVYDGSINTTYITIFRDIAAKLGINDDYVFYRSGQYDYTMVVGDLYYTGSSIGASEEVTVYTISTNTSNYNTGYQFFVRSQQGFDLDLGSDLFYSNLGHYPDLIERNDYYAFATLILLFVALFCYLLRSILLFCLRRRS